MKNTYVLIAILSALSVGLYFLSQQQQPPTEKVVPIEEQEATTVELVNESGKVATLSASEQGEIKDGESMEEHLKNLGDNNTIMLMAGIYTPNILYVSPGQTITVLNHESKSSSLISDGLTTFSTAIIESGGQAAFTAPTKPGTYTYHNSLNVDLRGTLIVEK